MTDRELLRHIERQPGQRAGYKQLVREFGLGGGRERRLLLEHLARLTAAGQLTKTDREQWAIARVAATRDNLVAGRLDMHRDGYGFVRVAGERTAEREGDVFIPPGALGGAMQGDQVLVELEPPGRDGRKSGAIVRVLTRRNATVVGLFQYGDPERQAGHQVRPFDERMTQPIIIPFHEPLPEPVAQPSPHRVVGEQAPPRRYDDLEGLVVDVEITDWPTPTRAPRGRVVEVLGRETDFGVDVEIVIRKHHLPRVFPDKVLEEARQVARLNPEVLAARRDFRDRVIVTIDGETARDFDDAVRVEELEDGGWGLEVHIADVAEYVQPASSLDLEARLRGNSVYFPDRAIPMLPHELSTGICSLRPDEDRLVLSCLMRIDPYGNVLEYEVTEGVIRSARRMTYTQVAAILEECRGKREDDEDEDEDLTPDGAPQVESSSGEQSVCEQFVDLVPEFLRMQKLAKILYAKRSARGSIDFDLPEPIIEFDEWGAMKAVTRSERNWAHRLIEEFMLAANECVASWLAELAPSIYRIHEKPDPRRILDFEETAATFGYSLGVGAIPVKRFAMKNDRRDAQRRNDRSGRATRSTNTRAIEVPEDIAVTPKMYAKLAAKIAGQPEERILSYLMLRSLKQARYSEENDGHFALAAPFYTHFTSPIRRYPDLIVHRIAKQLLRDGVSGEGVLAKGEPHARVEGKHIPNFHAPKRASGAGARKSAERSDDAPRGTLPYTVLPESELAAIATESSENERRAAGAERELVEWKKIKFMENKVGDEFSGMILNATKYGLFVELDELFIEGLVPLSSLGALDGDYYTFHEPTREIIGENYERTFGIGQRVEVLLERIDFVERRLQFSIVLPEDESPLRKPGKKAPKPKKAKKEKKQSMQGSSPKSRIPAPKKFARKGKKRR